MEEEDLELAEDDEEVLVDGRLNLDIVEVEGVARNFGDLFSETSRCGEWNSFPTVVLRYRMTNWDQSMMPRRVSSVVLRSERLRVDCSRFRSTTIEKL